jgi:Formylglycine-generating sulfatase enzyme.
MKFLNRLYIILIIFFHVCICSCGLIGVSKQGIPPLIPGTIQISDTFSVSATAITVYDYTSFIVDKGFDPTLFPSANFIETAPYKELFTELHNHSYHQFLKSKGRGSYTFYVNHPTGNKANKRKLKKWLELPIGGITKEQATLYCNWVANYYNQFLQRHDHIYYYEIHLITQAELNLALHSKSASKIIGYNNQLNYRFVSILHKR